MKGADEHVALLRAALSIFADKRNFDGCGGCCGWSVDVPPMEIAQAALDGRPLPEGWRPSTLEDRKAGVPRRTLFDGSRGEVRVS